MTFFTEIDGEDRKKSSAPGPAAVPPSPDVTIGALLKARRLELGLKHKDISKDIKIKSEYLRAIEDEEFDLLPTPEYLRLFLKTYAVHLGFDAQEIYGIYDTQEMPVKKPEKKEAPPEIQPPLPPPIRANMKTIFLVSIGAIMVLIVIFALLFGLGGNETEPVELTAPAEQAESNEMPLVDSMIDTAGTPTPAGMPAEPLTSGYRLQMRGIDSTWMVIQADRDTVFVGFFEPGETRWWNADSSFKFSLSNFTGVEASINGRYLKPFGRWGGPVQAREVGGFNLDQFLDSTRLMENGSGLPGQQEGEGPR